MGEKYLQVIDPIRDLYTEYIMKTHNSIIKRQVTQLKTGKEFE